MLDHAPSHIGDVEGAVWAIGEIDWAEAFAGAGEEIFAIVSVDGGDHAIFFGVDIAFDEMGGGFAGEGIAEELGGEGIASVDEGPGGSRKFLEAAIFVENSFAIAAVDAWGDAGGEEALAGGDFDIETFDFFVIGVAGEGGGGE